MSADKPSPKRRIVVRMTARDKSDPESVLNAVRNALSGHGITLDVRTTGAADPSPAPQPEAAVAPAVVKDEVLETKARETAAAILSAAAAEADKKTAAAERDAALDRVEIVAAWRGARAYIAYWCGQGVRMSVKVLGKLGDALVGAVAGAFGKGKKGE